MNNLMTAHLSNARVLRKIKHTHQVYAIGDSLTYGGVYLSRLSTLLGSQWGVINRGISGDSISGMLARLNVEITTSGDAECCIITGGINSMIAGDSAATIEAELQSIYTELYNAGITVIAGTITPFKSSSYWTVGRQAVVDEVNAWILATAINVDHKIDLYAILEDPAVADTLLPAYASVDWLHPSTAGYNAFADAIYAGSVFTPNTAFNSTSVRVGGLTVYLNQNLQTSDAPKFTGITIGTNAVYVSSSKPDCALFGSTADHAEETVQVTGTGYFSGLLNAAGSLQLSGSTFYLNSTAAGTGLISSTSHSGKGKINLGNALYVDEVNKYCGVGTDSPTAPIDVQSSLATSLVVKIQQFADAHSPLILLARSKGNSAAKTAVTLGQTVGSINFAGYDGSAMLNLASISGIVGNTPGTNDMPGTLIFNTTPDGAAAPTESMRIGYNKLVTCAGALKVATGFGCNSKTEQTAYASGGALAAYGAGANGFDSGANASALHAMVVSIRAALVANGIMS